MRGCYERLRLEGNERPSVIPHGLSLSFTGSLEQNEARCRPSEEMVCVDWRYSYRTSGIVSNVVTVFHILRSAMYQFCTLLIVCIVQCDYIGVVKIVASNSRR